MVLYPYRHHRKDHHDQTHHTNRHNRCHTRTHHRLHHRTTNRPTTRQRTTLHHHHIITMQILSRRQAARPGRTRHIHRPHRHTMVPRRSKPLQRHRMVTPSDPWRRNRGAFFYTQNHNNTKQQKQTKQNTPYTAATKQNRGGKTTHTKPPSPGTLMSFSRGRSAHYGSVRSDSGLYVAFLGIVKDLKREEEDQRRCSRPLSYSIAYEKTLVFLWVTLRFGKRIYLLWESYSRPLI